MPFLDLTVLQLYQIMQLRSEVFVVEQNCVYQDLDGKDIHPEVRHLFISSDSAFMAQASAAVFSSQETPDTNPFPLHDDKTETYPIIAYARLLPKGLSYDDVSIGRIVLAPKVRGHHLGRKLIAHCIKHTLALWPNQAITIGAQSHLSKLYQAFGFVEVSSHYLEDGIEHVDMRVSTPRFEEYL